MNHDNKRHRSRDVRLPLLEFDPINLKIHGLGGFLSQVIDFAHFYVELGAIELGIPYILGRSGGLPRKFTSQSVRRPCEALLQFD